MYIIWILIIEFFIFRWLDNRIKRKTRERELKFHNEVEKPFIEYLTKQLENGNIKSRIRKPKTRSYKESR